MQQEEMSGDAFARECVMTSYKHRPIHANRERERERQRERERERERETHTDSLFFSLSLLES